MIDWQGLDSNFGDRCQRWLSLRLSHLTTAHANFIGFAINSMLRPSQSSFNNRRRRCQRCWWCCRYRRRICHCHDRCWGHCFRCYRRQHHYGPGNFLKDPNMAQMVQLGFSIEIDSHSDKLISLAFFHGWVLIPPPRGTTWDTPLTQNHGEEIEEEEEGRRRKNPT